MEFTPFRSELSPGVAVTARVVNVGCMWLIGRLLDLYTLIVFVSVVLSWIRISPDHPVARFVDAATRPALDPIRRVVPPMGGLDFSPMVLLLGLQLLRGLL